MVDHDDREGGLVGEPGALEEIAIVRAAATISVTIAPGETAGVTALSPMPHDGAIGGEDLVEVPPC